MVSSSTYEEKSIKHKHKPVSSIMLSSSSSLHLHSVQKSSRPSKSSKKPPAADQQPPPFKQSRVYKVKPIHFRELVQLLTGAPGFRQPTATSTVAIGMPTLQVENFPWARPSSSLAADHVDQGGRAAAVGYWNAEVLEESTVSGAMSSKQAEGLMMGSDSSGGVADFSGGRSMNPSFQAWCSGFALSSPYV